MQAQHALWFGEPIPANLFESDTWRVALGERLKEHTFFHNVRKVLGGKSHRYADLLTQLAQVATELRHADAAYHEHLMTSMLALVSAARIWAPESAEDRLRREAEGKPRPTAPFLQDLVGYMLPHVVGAESSGRHQDLQDLLTRAPIGDKAAGYL